MLIVRAYLREIAMVYLMTFAILVGVFAIEKFDYIARLAIDYHLDPSGFAVLFFSELPSIMDLILPIATLVAIYVAVLAIRERREFIILSAAGAGSGPLLKVTLSVACLAAAVSIVVSGFVKPVATQAFRQQYDRSLKELISKGPEGGRFFESKDMVVYTAKGDSREDRKLRVFGFQGARASYVYLSDCARMRVEAGQLFTDSCATHAYRFPPPADFDPEALPEQILPTECPTCDDERARLRIVYVEGRRTQVPFDMKTLFPTIERDRIDELNIFDLLRTEGGGFASSENAQRGVKAFVLAATNVFAVVCWRWRSRRCGHGSSPCRWRRRRCSAASSASARAACCLRDRRRRRARRASRASPSSLFSRCWRAWCDSTATISPRRA